MDDPLKGLVERDAVQDSANSHSSNDVLEAMLRRISAEATANATCKHCHRTRRVDCQDGILIDGSACPAKSLSATGESVPRPQHDHRADD